MKTILRISLTLLLFPISVLTQEDVLRNAHDETPDDPYVVVDKTAMPRQPAYKTSGSGYFTIQVNVDDTGMDIIGDAGNETSLAVDPTNNDRIVIGWRQFDDISSNFRQAGYGYSLDGGSSFTFPGVINPGIFRSDPVLDFDADGNFYYNSLRGTFDCDVYKIEDGGVLWDGPYPAFGGDKQWMRMDRTGGVGDKNNYSNWNASFTTCAPGYFTRSTDGSETFETCIIIDGNPFWGTLAVDDNGDLFISGRSGGTNVLIKSSNAKDPGATISWDFVTNVDLDGNVTAGTPVNPGGLAGQVWVDVDLNNDNVYMLASVQRDEDPMDVMFAKSIDGGVSFAPPVRINKDDIGNYNWFGTMAVAPNGRIDVVWLDTREADNVIDSKLYYSFSMDEGESWSVNRVLSDAFDPSVGYPNQSKMGDYFDVKSDNDHAHVAWCNTLNGGQDVYYTRITPALLGTLDVATDQVKAVISPNPVSSKSTIDFLASSSTKTVVEIYDINGKLLATLLDKNIEGPVSLSLNQTTINQLSSGVYFVTITANRTQEVLKFIID
ncbi:MAG: T9SS type A sorting domain-containing protein [Bacteroidetes bacterium]|nr:T9SS type A sorting domain-containing protein [Bacteroidota bacterium]